MIIEEAGVVCGSKLDVSKIEDWLGCLLRYLLMDLCVEVVGLTLSCL